MGPVYLVIFCYWVGPVPYLELFGAGPVEKNTLYDKNFKQQFKHFNGEKVGGSFRSKPCCHWGVNFQFKHIEHIEAKSNFLYGPPSRHSVALFNSELWQFFRCNCIVMTFGKGCSKVTAQGEVVWIL